MSTVLCLNFSVLRPCDASKQNMAENKQGLFHVNKKAPEQGFQEDGGCYGSRRASETVIIYCERESHLEKENSSLKVLDCLYTNSSLIFTILMVCQGTAFLLSKKAFLFPTN